MTLTRSHHLTEEYWELLGPNSPFYMNSSTTSPNNTQLQMANNVLEDHALEAQGDVTDAAAKATLSIAQAIL